MIATLTPAPADRPVVLLVEDDLETARVFRHVLEAEGYAARVVNDAEQALAASGREVPAAIVIDLHLPTLNGHELLRVLRGCQGLDTLPAAIITGDYMLDDSTGRDLEVLGARLYFKPIWGDELVQIVAALLS